MFILKCDRCKRIIAEKSPYVTVGYGTMLAHRSLCAACGKSIVGILKKYKLLPERDEKRIATRRTKK